MKRIGVDIGTTSVSAAVYDTEKHVPVMTLTKTHHADLEARFPGETLQDPALLTSIAKELLDELLVSHPDISGIGLCGQMHGILWIDEDGRAVSPLYTWQCHTEDEEEKLSLLRTYTKCAVSSGFGLFTVWDQIQGDRVPKASGIAGISEYLAMRLTGRKKPVFHSTMAAGLGFYDVQNDCFDREGLRKAGIPEKYIPEVCTEIIELGKYRDIPVYSAVGDNQAAYLGTLGTSADTLLVNIGTGSQVSLISDAYVQIPGIETRPFPGHRYLFSGSALAGGKAYASLHDFFASFMQAAGADTSDLYTLMETLGREAEDGMRMDTRILGTREEPSRTGSIMDITAENFTPGGLVRACLAGMSQELFDMYMTMCRYTGRKAEKITASGNAVTRNALLREILTETFGQAVQVPEIREAAACGAALSTVLTGDVRNTKTV